MSPSAVRSHCRRRRPGRSPRSACRTGSCPGHLPCLYTS
jgi:hypothetical protein